jgi:hypothetical protein
LLIEDLGHADLLSNQPFQHAQFSPLEGIDETASRGFGRIISVQRSQVVREAKRFFGSRAAQLLRCL